LQRSGFTHHSHHYFSPSSSLHHNFVLVLILNNHSCPYFSNLFFYNAKKFVQIVFIPFEHSLNQKDRNISYINKIVTATISQWNKWSQLNKLLLCTKLLEIPFPYQFPFINNSKTNNWINAHVAMLQLISNSFFTILPSSPF